MIQYVSGNLITMALDNKFDVIVHGCNCQNVMGAGIARQIRDTFPKAYILDQATRMGDRGKLGHLGIAREIINEKPLTVVNAYTQFSYGRGKQVSYEAIESCFRRLYSSFVYKKLPIAKIGMPMIGAGLAGGDWCRIEGILNKELGDGDVTVVKYDR